MSIAFLEGAEYEEAIRQSAPEETVMTIGYAGRYDDERLAQGDDNLVFAMRDDLCAAIDELRSTIAAHRTNEQAQADKIIELEAQLAATMATIERAADVEQNTTFYVVTDNGRLLGSSPVAHDDLQHLADSENIGVYEIRGVRTGRYADPKTEIERLRIVVVDGATVWGITENNEGWRLLYRGAVGRPLEIAGDNMTGIPADCPASVSDEFWTK